MDKESLKSLNSPYTKLYEDNGKLFVSIVLEDIVNGNINLSIKDIPEEELLTIVQHTNSPKITITDDVRNVYVSANLDYATRLHEDVYEYLEIAAKAWGSSNKSPSAVTGSLIGKISKSHSVLNETLFNIVGGEKRDAYLKELIKSNMPLMKYFWGQ